MPRKRLPVRDAMMQGLRDAVKRFDRRYGVVQVVLT
jgi:hypothetical protein